VARGIYKRGGIYWVRYAGLDGKLIRESSHSEKFKVALDLYHQRKDEVKKGKLPETVRIAKTYLFSELAGEYLRFAERQRGFRQKKSVIEQLTKTFGPLPLRRFSTMLIEHYQTERLNTGKKPATINRHLATLKHMFRPTWT
jgi:hypothetical protein